jgi:ParB family chromosome partitioning protein
VDEFGLTQEQVAERVGKSRVAVTNTLRLLRLPAEVQQALADGTIREGHARAMLGLPTSEAQVAALKTVMVKALSVRQTEELVRRLLAGPPPRKPDRPVNPETEALEEEFRETLGTKVNLYKGRKGRGRLVIHFYSEEELQTIYDVIVGGG